MRRASVLAAGRFYLPAVAMYWLVEGCETWYEKMTGGRKGASRLSRNKRYMLPAVSEMFRISMGADSPRSDKQSAVLQAESGCVCTRRGSWRRPVVLAVPEHFSSTKICLIFSTACKKDSQKNVIFSFVLHITDKKKVVKA